MTREDFIGLILKRREGCGFLTAFRATLGDFLRVASEGNPEEQLYQPEENPVLPDSFNQISILFSIRFPYWPS